MTLNRHGGYLLLYDGASRSWITGGIGEGDSIGSRTGEGVREDRTATAVSRGVGPEIGRSVAGARAYRTASGRDADRRRAV